MPTQGRSGKPTTRRYSEQEKAQAVRLVRQLRAELGTDHGTIQRVATQLGYGTESVRSWVRQADMHGFPAGATALASRTDTQSAFAGLGEPAELLDVDVHELAGVTTAIPVRGPRPTIRLASGYASRGR